MCFVHKLWTLVQSVNQNLQKILNLFSTFLRDRVSHQTELKVLYCISKYWFFFFKNDDSDWMPFDNKVFNIGKVGKYIRAIRFALKCSFSFQMRSFEFEFEFQTLLDCYFVSTCKIHFRFSIFHLLFRLIIAI